MKPTPKSKKTRVSSNTPSSSGSPGTRRLTDNPPDLLAFGAHPDDIEFGCGGVIARETRAGRRVHLVICSHGEAGSNGTPAERKVEAERAAALLGATVEFIMQNFSAAGSPPLFGATTPTIVSDCRLLCRREDDGAWRIAEFTGAPIFVGDDPLQNKALVD